MRHLPCLPAYTTVFDIIISMAFEVPEIAKRLRMYSENLLTACNAFSLNLGGACNSFLEWQCHGGLVELSPPFLIKINFEFHPKLMGQC